MSAKTSSKDLVVALSASALGAAALALAMHAGWSPGDMLPGIEGCLTAGVVGTVLALLHPMEYWRAVAWSAPIMVVEYASCAFAGGPALGVVGLHLVLAGLLGIVLALRAQPAAAGATEAREARLAGQHG